MVQTHSPLRVASRLEGEMRVDLILGLLIHVHVLWELWTGTSRVFLRLSGDTMGWYGRVSLHTFRRDSEDGSGYFWMSWVPKAGLLGVFWFRQWIYSG